MRRWLWLVAGLLLVAAGVVVALSAPDGPADFGWFAYTPLEEGSDWYMEWDSGDGPATAAVVLTRQHVVGYAVLGLGVLVVATGAAYRLGSRRARHVGAAPGDQSSEA
jgi:heme/copper-type cytochrome/quinol oxidase subunit 1